ncbi:MAG TPA: putative baseplate assembly protein [Fimbriimonadaceae bacterium]|nr:putative baseplate assembly protein [Fimbriimonadaceae bacterium]
MSLPSPNLDDRKFQDIVDDVKRQIGLRCPEWSDHNVSDPGVTLLELFAYMSELTMFRLNQVPEKNYIKFLEMLGVTLEMPEPAKTDLRFRLSRAIEDMRGAEEQEVLLKKRDTVAATVRTETEEAIEFSTDLDLRMVRPKMEHVIAVPASEADQNDDLVGGREFTTKGVPVPDTEALKVFSPLPRTGDALYLGFSADIRGNLIELRAQCLKAAATGLNEDYPAQVWEFFNPGSGNWERLEIVRDTTYGFNRSGVVEVSVPWSIGERDLGGKKANWIRCRYTIDPEDLPPKGVEQKSPDAYQKSPEVTYLEAATIGGTVPAGHCTTIWNEVLGQSDGYPGQVFKLRHAPILDLAGDETVLVGPVGDSPEDMEGWVPWTQVRDFAESGPDDRHFVVDTLTGEIYFGPNIVQPDGSGRQYGAIPAKGLTIGLSGYRVGGGTHGNVREGRIRVLKRSIPFISEVGNPRPAAGGRDRENIERAKLRAREIIQVRNRAVTAEDYEFLARKASSGVGRARCVQPLSYPGSIDDLKPGTVKVLLVPTMNDSVLVPRPADLKVPERTVREVREYLDERRLLTTVLEVGEPEYLFVSIDIKLVADPRADADLVARRVEEQLNLYLHPLKGGPSGDGWPFKRALTLADIYAQVGAVRGVAFLLDARIFVSRLVNKDDGIFGPEEPVSNAEGVRLEDFELLCTRRHNIRVVPMAAVGAEEAAAIAD